MRENENEYVTQEFRGAGSKGGLTRRSFLGTATLAGLATAAAGLVGCSSNQGSSGAAAAADSAKSADNVTAQAADGAASNVAEGGNQAYTAWSEGINPQRDDFRRTSGDLSHVLSPWKLSDWEFGNRIVKSAAGSGYIFGGYGISDACRVDATKMFIGGDRGLVGSWDPNPADGDKSVMVVGAGPAGMEAARVAAQRGYRVALYEKESQLGGLSTFAASIKGPRENIARWLAWCEKQLELEGVTVVTGTEVDAAFVREQAPDVLMLAVGGAREGSGLASVGATNVISLADIAGAEVGERVTILGSNLQATDLAFYLIEQGKAVSIVTPDAADLVSKGQANWVKQLSMPMLYARGTRLWPQAEVTSVGDGEVTVRMVSGATTTYPCDTVIEAFDMVPNKGMLDELADSGIDLYAIGDCDDPWNIQYAIRAGNHTARIV